MMGLKLSSQANVILPDVVVSVRPSLFGFFCVHAAISKTIMATVIIYIVFAILFISMLFVPINELLF